jgi:hypothetical protein
MWLRFDAACEPSCLFNLCLEVTMPAIVSIIRKVQRSGAWAALFVAVVVLQQSASAVEVKDFAVQVSATIQKSPPKITLSWPQGYAVSSYTVSRKPFNATSWSSLGTLSGSATSFSDSNVSIGNTYEYRIVRSGSGYTGYGFCYAGIDAPMVENRGKVLLLVDSSMASPLANELTRLQQDLVGDGWTVVRKDVSRTSSVTSVKSLITSESGVKSLFLFGRIPVPYSGSINPDGHPDHLGTWPADVFYGDINGSWTDSNGDGQYNQSTLPSDVELEVGRVDLSNMSAFSKSETELLRQYLNKDHNFRHKITNVTRAGLVDDAFGNLYNEAFAANGWRNLAPMFGASNVAAADWSTLSSSGRLWAYGCGAGSYTSCAGVTSTSSLAGSDPRAVFTMLFGSYFGDWDTNNCMLRAPLCTPTYGLTCAWAGGRPSWFFHHMALGETIGYSTRLSQNNSSLYPAQQFARMIHVALMGDPTLRMHPVKPASNLTATISGGARLSWSASSDPVVGYHVYRGTNAMGPFTRLTSSPTTSTAFTDASITGGTYTYMVRAVALESSGSGTYYNPSQGVFGTLGSGGTTPPPPPPPTAPSAPTNLAGTAGNAQATLAWNSSSGATSYRLKRSATSGGPYTTISTESSTSCVNSGLINGSTYYYVCSAVNSAGESSNSNQCIVTPTAPPTTGGTLPAPWIDVDIGTVAAKGSASLSSGVFNVKGGGRYLAYSQDSFNFCYQPMSGDGQIVARVSSVQNTGAEAKAGVMIRESLEMGSRHAFIGVSAEMGVLFTRRTSVGAQTLYTNGANVKAPYWVKLVRAGSTFTAYQSSDGSSWAQVGSQSITMNASVLIGLAVNANSSTAINTSTFDNVSVNGSTTGGGGTTPPPPPPPTGTVIQLPAKIEAENFRAGGEGVGYHELTATNYGGQGTGPVDRTTCNDVGGGLLVGWIDPGEWLAFDIKSTVTARYNFAIRVAGPSSSQRLHVEIDGSNVSGIAYVPSTGAYDKWGTLNIPDIEISGGTHVLKLYFDGGYFNVNYLDITSAAAAASAPLISSVGATPNPATVNEAVSFYAAPVDGNANMSFTWDFGDGENATGATPSHIYGSAGNYTARVTATDESGATQTEVIELPVNAVE